jgi:hypothetical protein
MQHRHEQVRFGLVGTPVGRSHWRSSSQSFRRTRSWRRARPHPSSAGGRVAVGDQDGRNLFERRSFALRNADRTNLLLGLARLHLNNQDDVGHYPRILRAAAEREGGHAIVRQRANRDTKSNKGDPQPSLR